MKYFLAATCLLLCCTCGSAQPADPRPGAPVVKVIKAGRLIDPTQGTVLENMLILIDHDSITAIGKDIPIPEMNAIVEEAHLWGRKTCAHAHGTVAIKMAVKAGVASIEHGSMLDDEAIRMMKERGTYLVADIYNDDYIRREYGRLGFPEKIINKEKLVGQVKVPAITKLSSPA